MATRTRPVDRVDHEKPWDDRHQRVLTALADGASAAEAAAAGGVTRQAVHKWRQANEAYAVAYHDAEEAGTDRLETVARKRAIEGSDTLLIFLLKARRPDKYRDTVKVDQTTTIRDERVRKAAAARPELLEELARTLAGEPA